MVSLRNCWQNYRDFRRCQREKGEEHEGCRYFQRAFLALCPNSDVSFCYLSHKDKIFISNWGLISLAQLS